MLHVSGPMLVTAGPGSGKTTVLTLRIQHLLNFMEPEQIAVFTFSRKSASDMKKRFAALTDQETAQRVCFGTFHSVFYRWLVSHGVLVKGAAASGEITYEDVLTLTQEHMESWRMWESCGAFLIDEFQDINAQQFDIVRKMVSPPGGESRANLFVVGDEDQSIYAFRGSDPSLFVHFADYFPGCQRVDLSVNFRCANEITRLSQKLIRHNKNRFDKTIRAKEGAGEGSIRCFSYFDEREEARCLAMKIERELANGKKREEAAVLCRTRAEAGRVARALREAGVPVIVPDEVDITEGRQGVFVKEDLDDMIRFGQEPARNDLYLRMWQIFPKLCLVSDWRRYRGKPILKTLCDSTGLDLAQKEEMEELDEALERASGMSRKDAYRYLLLNTGYLREALRKLRKQDMGLRELIGQVRELFHPSSQRIKVMTVHGAKGLEFDNVYVTGLSEGFFPRKEAFQSEERLEEERRLLYVAVTRARRNLTLSWYEGMGTPPSRFLKEMGLLTEESPRKRTFHRTYG